MPQSQPFTGLARENLASYVRERLRRGGGTRPELSLLEDEGRWAVVKDYRASGWMVRTFAGPWLMDREEKIYRILAGAPGVPRLLRRLDRHAIVVEHIRGRSCADYADGELPAEFFDRLREVVEGIHSRGVVHCDIKNRGNIVVNDEGEPYIVDFASAFTDTGSLLRVRRFLFEQFRGDDLRAVMKAKILVAQVGSAEEAHFAFYRGPAERVVRALRNGARRVFKLLAGG